MVLSLMNTSWLDIFYNTFARTVNWMRSTTERTPTTTLLYCGHWKNKNQVNCFLILGWWVGKYPHSFGIETGIKIDVAASSFISSWWNFRSHSASNNNTERHLPQRYFIQARLTDERKPSEVECTAFIKKKFWERLG